MVTGLDFHISTQTTLPTNALSYWNDFVCKTLIGLEVARGAEQKSFYGVLDGHQLGDIDVCKITSHNSTVRRTKDQISLSNQGFFMLNYQLKGKSIISQDGKYVVMKPNDLTFTDSTRPYELDFQGPFEQLVIKIPRNRITYGTSYITANTARLLDDDQGLGKIFKNFILTLGNELGSIDSFTRKYLANTLVHLLNDYLNAKFVNEKSNTPSKETMLLKIKSYVEEKITDPQLCIQHIAETFNCSKRQLHNIFSEEAVTIHNYIKEYRLEKCRDDIENYNLSKLTIAEIGYKNGYNNISNFVKSFKNKFGIPPGEYRNIYTQSTNFKKIGILS